MVRTWNAKFDARGDITGFEAVGGPDASVELSQASGTSSVAQSVATPGTSSVAQSVAAPDAATDIGFQAPTQSLVQELMVLTQGERLARAEQARGSLVEVWKKKAATDGKGRDFRGIISNDCMAGVQDLMQVRKGTE